MDLTEHNLLSIFRSDGLCHGIFRTSPYTGGRAGQTHEWDAIDETAEQRDAQVLGLTSLAGG